MNTITIIAHIAELLAAILASIYFYKVKNTSLNLLPIYLWYVVVHEICSYFFLRSGLITFELVNLNYLLTSLFVIWTAKKSTLNTRLNKIIIGIFFISIIFHLSEFITKGISQPWFISQTAGPILGLIALCCYIIYLFDVKSVINPFKDLFTYFLLGFALYFVASPVIFAARIYFQDNYPMSINLSYIMATIAILMYLIFSFGFIWSEKRT